ncbi:glycosyltransferase family 4 protein [Marinobacter lacisalsi]|uniref:Glycosyltransferase family 4 protein n=1 Tax=Marinobacter lacisalsi TaxID=475979 RepID=A0ABV8QI78_9GAMM
MRRVVFVVNSSRFFLSHRLPVAQAAKGEGYDVHVVTPSDAEVDEVRHHGFVHHAVPMSRSGQNPLVEMVTFIRLWLLFWRLRPDLVHLVTIKPVLYGGIACRLSPVRSVVAAISGLGSVFRARSFAERLRRFAVSRLYRVSMGGPRVAVIFQNESDRNLLVRVAGLPEQKANLIRGSGVDLAEYNVQPEPEGPVKAVFASRLLGEKGVRDFVDAARLLRERGVKVECLLVGEPDPGNPTTVRQDELDAWRAEGVVQCLGFCKDIAELFTGCHMVVLPSYYGEGLPKVLVEAAAAGRAVITTDHPGCRDAIVPGRTGLLVPLRQPGKLADAIQHLVDCPEERKAMGAEGRKLAESEFSVDTIVRQHLEIYRRLLSA